MSARWRAVKLGLHVGKDFTSSNKELLLKIIPGTGNRKLFALNQTISEGSCKKYLVSEKGN